MKSKVWSIISIVFGIVCFVAGISAFLVAAIGGRVTMNPVAATNYVLSIGGIVLGALGVYFSTYRTDMKQSVVAGVANLGKIGIMLCIIVIAATAANVK